MLVCSWGRVCWYAGVGQGMLVWGRVCWCAFGCTVVGKGSSSIFKRRDI